MTLPDRTLCWVEGPPWDRICTPVEITDEMIGRAWGAMCQAENIVGRSTGIGLESVRVALVAALGVEEMTYPDDWQGQQDRSDDEWDEINHE